MVVPTAIGYAVDGWGGAARAFFWVTLVRVALVHHMTWSINSVCHVWGTRPFATRDRSTNVAWLAPVSGGESWHNYHHADPSSARHGVLPRQLDTSAIVIRQMERAGLVVGGQVAESRADRPEAGQGRECGGARLRMLHP